MNLPESLLLSVLGMFIVFVALVFLMLAIKAISLLSGKEKTEAVTALPEAAAPMVPMTIKTEASGSYGDIALNGVGKDTAAMIMAITADEIGVPLNELRFKYIKEINK